MTDHSIEELKRQLDAAESRLTEARRQAMEAKHRYDAARFAATGFAGCIAEFTDRQGKKVRFIPHRVSKWSWSNEIEGNLLKKDGTEGQITARCDVSKARIVGPWPVVEK